MKNILVLVSAFLVSASAFAMPSVGDEAMFAVTATQTGQTLTGTLEMKLMSEDATSNTWSEQITTTIAGQSSVQTSSVNGQQLIKDGEAQAIIAECTLANGTLDTVTVPAGTFDTCVLPSNDTAAGATGKVWIGNVTFGIVQEDLTYTDGRHVVMQLQSTIAGQ